MLGFIGVTSWPPFSIITKCVDGVSVHSLFKEERASLRQCG
jgi:hypothetical protein